MSQASHSHEAAGYLLTSRREAAACCAESVGDLDERGGGPVGRLHAAGRIEKEGGQAEAIESLSGGIAFEPRDSELTMDLEGPLSMPPGTRQVLRSPS